MEGISRGPAPKNRPIQIPKETRAMRKLKVPAYFGPLFLFLFMSIAMAQTASAQAPTFFISCSTSGNAGVDTYYTGVFEIGAKPGRSPHPPNAPGANIGGTWMVPAVLSQTVLDHFYAYLTPEGLQVFARQLFGLRYQADRSGDTSGPAQARLRGRRLLQLRQDRRDRLERPVIPGAEPALSLSKGST